MNLLKRANKTKVDPKLMSEILEAVAELSAGQRDFEGTTIEIVKRVHELDLPIDNAATWRWRSTFG